MDKHGQRKAGGPSLQRLLGAGGGRQRGTLGGWDKKAGLPTVAAVEYHSIAARGRPDSACVNGACRAAAMPYLNLGWDQPAERAPGPGVSCNEAVWHIDGAELTSKPQWHSRVREANSVGGPLSSSCTYSPACTGVRPTSPATPASKSLRSTRSRHQQNRTQHKDADECQGGPHRGGGQHGGRRAGQLGAQQGGHRHERHSHLKKARGQEAGKALPSRREQPCA